MDDNQTRYAISLRQMNQVKRVLDLLLTIPALLLTLPLFVIIASCICLDSPGPVFFAHQRVGRRGQPFFCYKFRTMVENSGEFLKNYLQTNTLAREEWNSTFKLTNDPRVTRLGKWLRRMRLDELPQLFNVLKGEMSLVGPRPVVFEETAKYRNHLFLYYSVRPGITGYWQVHGGDLVDYETRVQMDCRYIQKWSLRLDLVLLWKTLKLIFWDKGRSFQVEKARY